MLASKTNASQASSEEMQKICLACGVAKKIVFPCRFTIVHPCNRGGTGVDPPAMQNLLNEIADGGGWAWTAVGNPQAVEKGAGQRPVACRP